MNKVRQGKFAGTSASHEIRFSNVIESEDELIAPAEMDNYLAPGFIDVQVNGFAGVDYNDPAASREEIARSLRVMFSTGVTRCFPTVITGPADNMAGALRNMSQAKRAFESAGMAEGTAIEAFHVEGPHISPDDGPRGAHPRDSVRPPDVDEFKRWQEAADGLIRLITVSPEWPQAPSYIEAVTRTGVVVSVGHTKATSEQINAAVDAGATMSTHLGNGAHTTLHKTNNYIWDQISEERLSPSFILDGIHIPAPFFRAAVRAKGVAHSVLVTDAVMPAMCKPGYYQLGTEAVELKADNRVVLRNQGRLAGSSLRMDHAVGNAVKMGRVSLRDALAMATVNPARVCRVAGRQRALAPGEKADLIRFRWNEAASTLTVVETIVAGATVYSAD